MVSKLTDMVYCLAYHNHRYAEDEYALEFYTDWHTYVQAVSDKKKTEGSKVMEFSFRPIDLIKM